MRTPTNIKLNLKLETKDQSLIKDKGVNLDKTSTKKYLKLEYISNR